MARTVLPPFLCLLFVLLPSAQSKLSTDYYNKTCPNFAEIVQGVAVEKQLAIPTTAGGALRLFFHDCVVGGCDASILLSSSPFSLAERDVEVNKALPGDAFDLVIRAKTKLELACPGVVSCSDILAEATRDLISMVGGPYYPVRLGRKDSLQSHAADVAGHIALPNMTLSEIIDIFAAKGFNVQEMVALSGAHTIGFTHCSQFADRIYNFSKTSQVDPTMNPDYARELRKFCENYKSDQTLAAFNDPMSPGKFDNTYYVNMQRGVALLASDQALILDPRTRPFAETYANDQNAFFQAFAHAMEKVSVLNVKTGAKGEVRRKCDVTNALQ
ncbi:hypothetical protein M569_13628, partial [Genlisea aurea]